MDSNGCDNPPEFATDASFPPRMWSNPLSEASDNSPQSSIDYGVISGKVDLIEALFKSSVEFHGTAVEISQCQEPPWFSPAPLKAESGLTPWESASSSQNQVNLGEEDDGVVTVLSSRKKIPNQSCSINASSGESENYGSSRSGKGARHHHCSNLDEVVSRGSSNPPATHLGTSKPSRLILKGKERGRVLFNGGDAAGVCPGSLLSDSSTADCGFKIASGSHLSKSRKRPVPSDTDLRLEDAYEPDMAAITHVKEMIYRAAALRPVSLASTEAAEKPKRKNVRISSDPQTVAARQRRERISARLRVLQRLVPGGSKMDTASMLDEAASYLKFLKSQISALENRGSINSSVSSPSLPLSPPSNQLLPMHKFSSSQTQAPPARGQVSKKGPCYNSHVISILSGDDYRRTV